MNSSTQIDFDRDAAVANAERSLRLIASLPAPLGIEDRVKAGLRETPIHTGVIAWPLSSQNGSGWSQISYLRAAAAAAIVFVVAGGGWGVHARFRPAPAPTADAVPQRIEGGGGLSAAGAKRTPNTVEGPKIAVPEKARQEAGAGSASAQLRSHGDRRHVKKNRTSVPSTPPAIR